MGEISKEAWDEARAIQRDSGYRLDAPKHVTAIAAALQKHMDATAETRSALQECIQHEFERAEAAERQLAEEREWFATSQRALEEANARLAELVREVRKWLGTPRTGPLDGLSAILKRYESPEPAKAEPKSESLGRVTAELIFVGPDYAHSLMCGLGAVPEDDHG